MLLSSGTFAMYRAETHVFNTLAPRFGRLTVPANRRAMTAAFVRSDMFRVSGLDATRFAADIESGCRNAGDFLRIFMESIQQQQRVARWAETTPVHATHMPEIKATIPDALFVHVVRDGRDVAVSMMKQQWVRPLPMDRDSPERAAGAFWSWVVETGARHGSALGNDYLRVSYEDLVAHPQRELDRVGDFIAQRLDYEQILSAGVGSVSRPNTSFPGQTASFHGRWKSELDPLRADELEALLAPTLKRQGYALSGAIDAATRSRAFVRRAVYRSWFAVRHGMKRTLLGRRLASLSLFEPGAVKGVESGTS